MNERENNFMKHSVLHDDHTRNSRDNLPPLRLDVERSFTIFHSLKCFSVAPAQLCVPMSDDFKMNNKRIVLGSYGR